MKIICKVLLHIQEERDLNTTIIIRPMVASICFLSPVLSCMYLYKTKFQIVFLPGLLRIRPSTVRWSISAFSLHRRCKGLHSNPRWK